MVSTKETPPKADKIRTVGEWGPVRELAIAARNAARERVAGGEGDAAISALDVALREVKRMDGEIEHSRELEAARAQAAKVRAANESKAELVTVEEQIAARRPHEVKHAEGIARARLAVEALERDGSAYYSETEKLLNHRSLLTARISGRAAGLGVSIVPEWRLMWDAECARQAIVPQSTPTDFARRFLPRPTKPPAPAPVAVAETSNATATTRSKRGAK